MRSWTRWGKATTAKLGHASQKQGAPAPQYPTWSIELRQISPIHLYKKRGAPGPRWGQRTKPQLPVPTRNERAYPTRRRGDARTNTNFMASRQTCLVLRFISNDAASSLPTAGDPVRSAPNGRCPCPHIRGHHATNNTGYPNLDANEPYAVARASPFPRSKFYAGPATNLRRPCRRPPQGDADREAFYPQRYPFGQSLSRENDCEKVDGDRRTCSVAVASPRNEPGATLARQVAGTNFRTWSGLTPWGGQELLRLVSTPAAVTRPLAGPPLEPPPAGPLAL